MTIPASGSTQDVASIAVSLRQASDDAAEGLVDRATLVELILLAAVAQEHVLVIGPPGTAKSVAVHRVAETIGGRHFEKFLRRFTQPNEIFGPLDLRQLKEGPVETETTRMLPQAGNALLDEILHGPPPT